MDFCASLRCQLCPRLRLHKSQFPWTLPRRAIASLQAGAPESERCAWIAMVTVMHVLPWHFCKIDLRVRWSCVSGVALCAPGGTAPHPKLAASAALALSPGAARISFLMITMLHAIIATCAGALRRQISSNCSHPLSNGAAASLAIAQASPSTRSFNICLAHFTR